MEALLVRLGGVTAHFRDPRVNTAKIGLPASTLHAPPPCTIYGLITAAKGAWLDPERLKIGWRMDYVSVGVDFQTGQLPKRKSYNWSTGYQRTESSPVEREVLAFPMLSILAISGVRSEWFRRSANPLSLGRSEDLVTERSWQETEISMSDRGEVARQCLPLGFGSGTIYPAPLYFEGNRVPVGMGPLVDARQKQQIQTTGDAKVATVLNSGEVFYVWDFATAHGQKQR